MIENGVACNKQAISKCDDMCWNHLNLLIKHSRVNMFTGVDDAATSALAKEKAEVVALKL